jgi:hypothetical protein
MIIDKSCWERGCSCHDTRVDGEGVAVQKKEWVGLTNEERRHLRKQNQQHDAFALAIEAMLKEKNT